MRGLLLVLALAGCLPKGATVVETPTSPQQVSTFRFEMAEALLAEELYEPALGLIHQLRESNADKAEVDLLHGRILAETGLPLEAMELYQRADKTLRRSKDPRVPRLLGVLHVDAGEPDLAIAAFREATLRDSQDAASWNNLGFLLMSKGDEEAVDVLRRAVQLDSAQPRYKLNLGFAYFSTGNHRAALQTFKSTLPEADALYNFGLAFELAGNDQDAREQYKRALAAQPGHKMTIEALDRMRKAQ